MTSQAKRLLTTEANKFLREDRVLVYHYRANGSPVVKDDLAVIPRAELDIILSSHPTLTHTTKSLPRGARTVDIYQRDLMDHSSTTTAPAGDSQQPYPANAASNVAGVKLPLVVWVEGLLRGRGHGWAEIVVVSERMGGVSGAVEPGAAGVRGRNGVGEGGPRADVWMKS